MNKRSRDVKLGWANIECYFSCGELKKSLFSKLLAASATDGFSLRPKKSLLAYGEDPADPLLIASPSKLNEFEEFILKGSVKSCIANFIGTLYDVNTRLTLNMYFEDAIICVIVPENVIWALSDDAGRADFRRLCAFGNFCKDIAAIVSPVYAFLDTEIVHFHEMRLSVAQEHGAVPYNERFFSETELRKLYDWYINYYVKGPNRNSK